MVFNTIPIRHQLERPDFIREKRMPSKDDICGLGFFE